MLCFSKTISSKNRSHQSTDFYKTHEEVNILNNVFQIKYEMKNVLNFFKEGNCICTATLFHNCLTL